MWVGYLSQLSKWPPNLKFLLSIVIIIVQVRIEIFLKRTVVHLNEPNFLEENQECSESNFEYSHTTIRTVLFIICASIVFLLDWVLRISENKPSYEKLFYLQRLRVVVGGQFILTNLIPIILIKLNPNMYTYCVKQIQLFCPKKHNTVTVTETVFDA